MMGRTLYGREDILIGYPKTIECSMIKLIGRDHESVFVSGSGRIEILNNTEMRFYLYGQSDDDVATFKKRQRAEKYSYDALEQFRMIAVDYSGVEWNGGYTTVDFFAPDENGWPLTGLLNSLVTLESGEHITNCSSVELLLAPSLRLPMEKQLIKTTSLGEELIFSSSFPGQQSVEVLGTKIVFSVDAENDIMRVYAETSDQLRHPFLENWIAEPLRILLGGAVYPRAIARNVGDGRSHIWLRPSPRSSLPSTIGLVNSQKQMLLNPRKFWDAYRLILEYIASGKEFETSELTLLYTELSGAQLGSRWVLTMTLANTVEALAKMSMTEKDKASEFCDEDIAKMKAHLKGFKGAKCVRDRMLSNIAFLKNRSVLAYLRSLAKRELLDLRQVETWRKLRNSVMHGEMVLPWSSEEQDLHLDELMGLVHAMTWRVLKNG